MELKTILSKCDHTLLGQGATWSDIKAICDDGIKYATASVCIPPSFVKEAKEYVKDSLQICTVIGFPNGYNTTAVKVFETEDAIKNGADEIDMVINIGDLKAKKYDAIVAEMAERGEYLPLTTEDAVERTAAALGIFLAHGVNIIRVGLQATELLTGGEETMSAYHPAIGEMVYGRCFRDALEKALRHEKTNGKYAEISVNPADLSKMIGQKGANRQYLQMQFSLRGIRFCPDEKMAKNGFSVMLTE